LNIISKILSTFNGKIMDNLSVKRSAETIEHIGAVCRLKLPYKVSRYWNRYFKTVPFTEAFKDAD